MGRNLRKPDTRLDWRDPQMPCVRNYILYGGEIKKTVTPDYEQRYREWSINNSSGPHWSHDPTYNLRRKR